MAVHDVKFSLNGQIMSKPMTYSAYHGFYLFISAYNEVQYGLALADEEDFIDRGIPYKDFIPLYLCQGITVDDVIRWEQGAPPRESYAYQITVIARPQLALYSHLNMDFFNGMKCAAELLNAKISTYFTGLKSKDETLYPLPNLN